MSTDRDIVRGERCTSTGSIKGCGRRATWDRGGRPIVTLYAVANPKEPTVLVCADCIALAGLPVPEGVPTRHEPGVKRESSTDTSAAHKEARQAHASGVLALDPGDPRSCSELTISERKKARHDLTTWVVDPSDPGLRTPAPEQTDGTVQEEVIDRAQHVSTGESQAAQLVRERYATWAKRAHKWHAYLERERAWSTHGRLLSVLTGAASTLAAATVAPHYAPLVVGALMIATALIAWRGQVGQSRLESSRAADAWVSADRLAEVYKGLVVELDAALAHGGQGAKWVSETLAKSQQIEGAARFGVPEGLRSVLVEVCK